MQTTCIKGTEMLMTTFKWTAKVDGERGTDWLLHRCWPLTPKWATNLKVGMKVRSKSFVRSKHLLGQVLHGWATMSVIHQNSNSLHNRLSSSPTCKYPTTSTTSTIYRTWREWLAYQQKPNKQCNCKRKSTFFPAFYFIKIQWLTSELSKWYHSHYTDHYAVTTLHDIDLQVSARNFLCIICPINGHHKQLYQVFKIPRFVHLSSVFNRSNNTGQLIFLPKTIQPHKSLLLNHFPVSMPVL